MSKKIKVTLKDTYGTTRIYPHCNTAKLLADLCKQTTFTHSSIKILKALGYELEVITPEVKL